MYKSPIEIIESPVLNNIDSTIRQIVKSEQDQKEAYIIQTVKNFGVNVDKEELIKALIYDRQQYQKGYEDGIRDFAKRFKESVDDYVYVVDDIVEKMVGDAE